MRVTAAMATLTLMLVAAASAQQPQPQQPQQPQWQPVTSAAVANSTPAAAPAALAAPAAARPAGPAFSLGRPVAVGQPLPPPTPPVVQTSAASPVSALSPAVSEKGGPAPAPRLVVRAQGPDPLSGGPPPPPPPPGLGLEENYNCGVVTGAKAHDGPFGGFFARCWDKCGGWCKDAGCAIGGCLQPGTGAGGKGLFQSDHCFDTFASPVSNPFYMEDPRALTEVRPIFMWQHTPSDNFIFAGGENFFAGLQARVAFNDWLSLTINKLGWVWLEPHAPGFAPHAGFAEVHLGPKVTIIRNANTGTYLAAGLIFELAFGSSKVLQNTGNLSLDPYVSFAQNFLKTSYGSFNFMTTAGYSFGLDSDRTDFAHAGLHLDYDIGNFHKLYPLIELNWFHYTSNGGVAAIGFEGSDLFNAGTTNISGHDELRLALGARYKFTEHVQLGIAGEFSLIGGGRHLDDFRLTVDMIFRY